MTKTANKLVIFIPALNEEERIAEVIKSIPQKIEGITEIETLVVDDGSTDRTAEQAKNAGAQVVSHGINRGVGVAFQTGLDQALKNGADIFVNIDADGQFSAQDIPKMLAPIIENTADMAASNRFANGRPKNMSTLKYWGNMRMNQLINTLIDSKAIKFDDVSSGFRAFSKEAMLHLNLFGKFTYTQEMFLDLSLKGIRIKQIPIEVKYFKNRKSRVAGNVFKYALKTFWIIFRTMRDYKPLKFFGSMGLSIFALGVILDVFLLGHYLNTGNFSPYIFTGFIGAYLNTVGLGVIFLGLIADMFDRIRTNQEKILYYEKTKLYKRV